MGQRIPRPVLISDAVFQQIRLVGVVQKQLAGRHRDSRPVVLRHQCRRIVFRVVHVAVDVDVGLARPEHVVGGGVEHTGRADLFRKGVGLADPVPARKVVAVHERDIAAPGVPHGRVARHAEIADIEPEHAVAVLGCEALGDVQRLVVRIVRGDHQLHEKARLAAGLQRRFARLKCRQEVVPFAVGVDHQRDVQIRITERGHIGPHDLRNGGVEPPSRDVAR